MKRILLYFVLFFLVCKFFVAVESSAAEEEVYHGNRRYWIIEADGKTHIALHVLKEHIKLIFPNDKTFNDLASDIKLYSPTGNGKCQDKTNTLEFTLLINAENVIHGFINATKMGRIEMVNAYMYETCPLIGAQHHYASPAINIDPAALHNPVRLCFKGSVPFQVYEKDNTKHIMELQVSGSFECQAFIVLPSYMQIEDIKLPAKSTIALNGTFAGHDDGYWWKNKNDEKLPSTVSFDENKNVKIDILNSTVISPYFFRTGTGQPNPCFKFNFGSNCVDAVFQMYLNLKQDCQILLKLNQNGFAFSTSLNPNKDIKGLISSMVFSGNKVFVKVASPLSINGFETCQISNPSDVPSDQFVLQIAPLENIGDCEKAELVIANSDVANGIEVLIDRSKMIENETEKIDNSTVSSSTTAKAAPAGVQWWWFLIIGLLLITVVIIIIIVFCVCRRRRKSRKSNDSGPPKSLEKRAPKMKTAISKESPPKEKSKEKKKTKTKTKTKEEEVDESKKSEKPKQAKAKPAKKNIDEPGLESF